MPLCRGEEEKRETEIGRGQRGGKRGREEEKERKRKDKKKEEDKDGGHQLEGVESISWTGKSSSGSLLAEEWSDVKKGF